MNAVEGKNLKQVTLRSKNKIMPDDDNELLIGKPEVFMYEIPSGQVESDSDYDHRAADWDVANPTWLGKFLIYMAGPYCHIQLDDYQGNTYGQAVLEEYPGKTLKLVADSRRYFTLNVQNVEGVSRLVGIGFVNREDSAEINSTLKGYFAAVGCRKRKLEKSKPPTNDASPAKKDKTKLVESIYSKTNDPDYKYIRNNRFQCHYCFLSFIHPKRMHSHWLTVHGWKKACICVCGLPFPNIGERKVHVKNVHQDYSHCRFCKTILSNEQVVEHLLKVHKRDAHGKPVPKFRCSRCNHEFISRVQLIEHFQHSHSHSMKQSSNSEDCGIDQNNNNGESNSSERNDIFDEYRKTDPTYPYISGNLFQCHECSETFEEICNFASHWKDFHNLEFRSCYCKLIFPSLQQMLTHQEEFHSNLCRVCNKKFVSGSCLEKHLLNSHLCDSSYKKINSLNTTIHSCKYCEDYFPFREFLTNHVRSKHPELSTSNIDSTPSISGKKLSKRQKRKLRKMATYGRIRSVKLIQTGSSQDKNEDDNEIRSAEVPVVGVGEVSDDANLKREASAGDSSDKTIAN
ncbi:unnamed protein product [Allacma fusca]|uniref:C2H2-type domain-containing protein n=1 Tax=Allacma fusca TaxID=39272 RepID=A0A8J2LLA5_9HEXA|nr:unnamed protein product [Allacma fusca]